MKLIIEDIDVGKIEYVKEDTVENGEKKRSYYLVGPVLEAETENRNKRRYPHHILNREVLRYVDEKVKTHRSLGEMDHPPEPTINLDRVSHIFTELYMDGNVGIGKARLLDTPMGKIAQTLVQEGVALGMSTRGVGSINGGVVGDDFSLITPGDIVAEPSCRKAFVEGILENKEYIYNGNEYVEIAISEMKKQVDKNYSNMSKEMLDFLVNDFIAKIAKKS